MQPGGGQFSPEKGGPFDPDSGGQIRPERDGQIERIFHPTLTLSIFSLKKPVIKLFLICG